VQSASSGSACCTARLATTITPTFAPNTAKLLRQSAQYVDEIDGIEATPAELAEHGRFQAWYRKAVLRAYGWEACAARNCRK
jgi:hypothetical protein